jgi:hypothetical protein
VIGTCLRATPRVTDHARIRRIRRHITAQSWPHVLPASVGSRACLDSRVFGGKLRSILALIYAVSKTSR